MVFIFILGALSLGVGLAFYFIYTGAYRGDVVTDRLSLVPYARDISVFTMIPSEVYYPRSVTDVVHLVHQATTQKLEGKDVSLTVRAGGTCMSGGPLSTSAIVDMTRHMNSVVVNPETQTAIVEMGAYFRDIEDEASKHGLMFAPYPSSRRICGIGGMIGNNASGEKSVRFGATSDNILSMEVVLADATVVTVAPKKVVNATTVKEKAIIELAKKCTQQMTQAVGKVRKSASGYRIEKVLQDDLCTFVPLFSGAQGTLGIVTKATLKLVPIPEHLSLLVISAQNLEDIPVIVDEIFKWNPEAVETFDSNTFAMAREHLAEHANRTLPYVDQQAHLFILAEFSEGTEEQTDTKARGCLEALEQKGYMVRKVVEKQDIESIWEVRRNSFLLMRDHNPQGFKAVPCIEDVILPVPALAEFIRNLHEILTRRNIHYGFHGHIGEGSLRIVPVFDIRTDTYVDEITGLMTEVFALVKRLEGNMSADHSDGIIRTPFLKEFYGDELYGVFEEIKNIYDPLHIFNPKKKVGATKEDIKKYFDTVSIVK